MRISSRRKAIAFFITFGICLTGLAAALNVGWILISWRQLGLMIVGLIFFLVVIAGLILNTIFLVREIRRNEQHDSFINAVTHELKTPIASIRLYLETLLSRDVDPPQRREFYTVMLSDADRLLYTVEQVLAAGQAGQKGKIIHHIAVDMAELAAECADLARVRHHLPAGSIEVLDRFSSDSRPHVIGDHDELQAAIANLLDNAVKYSSGPVQIKLEIAPGEAERVLVRISDRGIGIPRAQQKLIFKRFYRVPGRNMAKVKGTGLGLFIVRSIVERHGGEVYAESEGEGKGSTFVVELPGARA